DPGSIAEHITSRTKAVIGVHLFGHPFDVQGVSEVCEDHNLYLVEDAAQAHGAGYRGKCTGSFGDVGCFSMYATKNMVCGEGGMITTSSRELSDRARTLINQGQSRKYVHDSLGYNFRMSDVHAAIGVAQFERLDELTDMRRANAKYLTENITREGVRLPMEREGCRHVYHQYALLCESKEFRDSLQEHLLEEGVGCAIHYPLPIPAQPYYKGMGYDASEYPVSSDISGRILSIPVHPLLTKNELIKICDTVNSF
ncbi:MAG: DegT/DnrJ/EryC1/StrS family aminotransferase, partial [Methermicoccaceae archaeon]